MSIYVLGIETSCDETAAAVVKEGPLICSNVVSSSLFLHRRYGGIVPEIAFRKHLESIAVVADSALKQAGLKLKQVRAVSVTSGPGLQGALLVGISFAKAVAFALGIPVLGIDHLQSHIYAVNFSESVKLPFIALVVSGGHTNLYLVRDYHKTELLGSTLDDACGEAFDKVAKILGLGYPGGPIIERLAKKGNTSRFKFSCSGTKNNFDFSFSGIKTAVLYAFTKQKKKSLDIRADIAAAFQECVVSTLAKKALCACLKLGLARLVVAGGVSANNYLRTRMIQEAKKEGIAVYFPSKKLCTDNAVMVAGLGLHLFQKRPYSGFRMDFDYQA